MLVYNSVFVLVVVVLVGVVKGAVTPVASYNPNRRETPVGGGVGGGDSGSGAIYSTLPEGLLRGNSGGGGGGGAAQVSLQQNPNYFNYEVDQPGSNQGGQFFQFQPQPQQQHNQQQQGVQPFVFQQPQQQQQQQFPVGGFGGSGNGNGGDVVGFGGEGFNGVQDFGGFADQGNNEIQDESPGFFTSLMNTLLEGTRFSSWFARAREMWSGLSDQLGGGVMSRVAMGAMALPFMLPMAAVPLGLGALGLMAFPILQLTLPGIRRSMGRGASLLASEECVERLSCNLAKRWEYDALFLRLERSENRWLNRVSKSIKAARTGENCKKFSCSPVTRMQDMVRTYLLGDGKAGDDQQNKVD